MTVTHPAVRERMLELETAGDDELPVGQHIAAMLGVEWSRDFDRILSREISRVPSVMDRYQSNGLADAFENWLAVAFAQGVTFAEAVRNLQRDDD